MTKYSKKMRYYDDDNGAEEYNERYYRDELKERRKLKRMKNALKTRRVDELIDMDDDY